MQIKKLIFYNVLVLFLITAVQAQVLGPCGTGSDKNAPSPSSKSGNAELTVQAIPLPGQQAIDFELAAVVGDEIKNIKLSDYDGKWRILCFFPAAFTFV